MPLIFTNKGYTNLSGIKVKADHLYFNKSTTFEIEEFIVLHFNKL